MFTYILRFLDTESIEFDGSEWTYYQVFETEADLVENVTWMLNQFGSPKVALFVAVQQDDRDPADPNDDFRRIPFAEFDLNLRHSKDPDLAADHYVARFE